MEPVLGVAALWVLFAGTHIGLTTPPVRGPLVARLGEFRFELLYSCVASVLWFTLVFYYATHRYAGPAGFALGSSSGLRSLLMAVNVLGVVLVVAGLLTYESGPFALFQNHVRAPVGLERITRHPFFAGVSLLALAHVLLAPHLVGVVFMGGVAVLATVGGWHQDHKLVTRRGAEFGDFIAATSGVPFAAVVGGRQRVVLRELPWAGIVAGLLAAYGVRLVHDRLFTLGGIWVSGSNILGAGVFTLQAWRRNARQRAQSVATVAGR